MPSQRPQRPQQIDPRHACASALKGERHPVVLGVPDDHWEEHQGGDGRSEVGPGRQQPSPLRRDGQQEEPRAGEQEDPVQLGQARHAPARACSQPPHGRCVRNEQHPRHAISTGQQRGKQRAVRQDEGAGGPAEHRRQIEGQGRIEPGTFAEQQPRQREHEPGGEREQQDERRAYRELRLAAEQRCGGAGQPPCQGRMIVGAEREAARGGDRVALVDAEPDGSCKNYAAHQGDGDEREHPALGRGQVVSPDVASLAHHQSLHAGGQRGDATSLTGRTRKALQARLAAPPPVIVESIGPWPSRRSSSSSPPRHPTTVHDPERDLGPGLLGEIRSLTDER